MVSHVLFDFFGTLVAYSPSRRDQGYERSFALLREAGSALDYDAFLDLWCDVSAELDEVAERTCLEFSMTDVGAAFLARALPRRPEERLVQSFVSSYLSEWNRGVRYLEGVPEILERLAAHFGLGIVTNTHDPDLVPGHLGRMGVSHLFSTVVTSVEFGLRKPDSRIFHHALKAIGAAPEECVYVGDHPIADYAGARAAGLRPILVDAEDRHGVPSRDRVASILEIEAAIASLELQPRRAPPDPPV